MKKFALALSAATAISSAYAEISTGFYLGANGSANSFAAKTTGYDGQGTTTVDVGSHDAGGGVYLGYGIADGCLYYGGEIGYQFIGSDFSYSAGDPPFTFKFKNPHQFNFAVRVGYKFTPATVAYIRLGGNFSKYRLRSSIPTLNYSKSHVTFAPGLGMETALCCNWTGRLEWTYDAGRSFRRATVDGGFVKFTSVHTQSLRLGIAYKF